MVYGQLKFKAHLLYIYMQDEEGHEGRRSLERLEEQRRGGGVSSRTFRSLFSLLRSSHGHALPWRFRLPGTQLSPPLTPSPPLPLPHFPHVFGYVSFPFLIFSSSLAPYIPHTTTHLGLQDGPLSVAHALPFSLPPYRRRRRASSTKTPLS